MGFAKRDKDLDIYIIRHAQSCQNSGDEYTDRFHKDDAPLSTVGEMQAKALAVRFGQGEVD